MSYTDQVLKIDFSVVARATREPQSIWLHTRQPWWLYHSDIMRTYHGDILVTITKISLWYMISWSCHSDVLCDIMRMHHGDVLDISWRYHSDVHLWYCSWYHEHITVMCCVMSWEFIMVRDVLVISWCYNFDVMKISLWWLLVYHGLWYSWYLCDISVACLIS